MATKIVYKEQQQVNSKPLKPSFCSIIYNQNITKKQRCRFASSANTIFLSYICQVNTTKNDENFLSDDIIHALYQLAKTLNKEQKKSLSAIHHHFPRLFLLSHGTSIQYNKIHDGYVVIIHPFSTLQIEHFRLPAPVITGFQFCTKRHLTIKKKKEVLVGL